MLTAYGPVKNTKLKPTYNVVIVNAGGQASWPYSLPTQSQEPR